MSGLNYTTGPKRANASTIMARAWFSNPTLGPVQQEENVLAPGPYSQPQGIKISGLGL